MKKLHLHLYGEAYRRGSWRRKGVAENRSRRRGASGGEENAGEENRRKQPATEGDDLKIGASRRRRMSMRGEEAGSGWQAQSAPANCLSADLPISYAL